jgi:hypothetical protein
MNMPSPPRVKNLKPSDVTTSPAYLCDRLRLCGKRTIKRITAEPQTIAEIRREEFGYYQTFT